VFVPLVLLAVPLYDTASVMVLRIREGRNPMVGDRRHFSHRLLKRGMSVRTALLTIYLCTAATAVGATLLPRVDTTGAILIFCQTAAIVSIIGLLESAGKNP
jgi:UDP-GlcNAc:undecaprenyl-phosphate GlcNAc-1-phosphate transferase